MDTISKITKSSFFQLTPMDVCTTKQKANFLERTIVVMEKQECIFLKIDDISYAEANGAYTNVCLLDGRSLLVCKNLKAFSGKLPENEFFRVHKSFIVNINSISKYIKSDGGYLILGNGRQIPVSGRKRDLLTKLVEQLSL